MYIYILIFFCISMLCLIRRNEIFLKGVILVLFVLCAFRGNGVDRDYQSYINLYNLVINGYNYAIEPTFYWISYVSHFLSGTYVFVFLIYAALAIIFKYLFIREWSPFWMLSVLIYFSNVFLLHEMTQIRVGLASAIGFYSLKYIIQGERIKYFSWICLAIMVHFSMAVFLFFPFLKIDRITSNFKIGYVLILVLFYTLYSLNIDLSTIIQYVNIGVVQEKYAMYKMQVITEQSTVNVFSVAQILHISITLFAILYSSHFSNNRKVILIFKIYALSPLCLIAFSTLPGFSLRLSELFNVSEMIFLPMLIAYIKNFRTAYFGAIVLSFGVLLINLYYVSLVKEYIL